MCTDFILSPEDQTVLRQLLLNRSAVAKSFAGTEYINKEEDVLDKALMRKGAAGWFF